jgi:hypothetical protein
LDNKVFEFEFDFERDFSQSSSRPIETAWRPADEVQYNTIANVLLVICAHNA